MDKEQFEKFWNEYRVRLPFLDKDKQIILWMTNEAIKFSRQLEPLVMQKPAGADEKLNGIRETLFQYLDVQLIPDIMNGIRELIRDARKEGIQFTLDIMHKHGTAKTFDDRIKKELAK